MTAAFYQNETKFYVAVDCIILGFDQKELNVLLQKELNPEEVDKDEKEFGEIKFREQGTPQERH